MSQSDESVYPLTQSDENYAPTPILKRINRVRHRNNRVKPLLLPTFIHNNFIQIVDTQYTKANLLNLCWTLSPLNNNNILLFRKF